MVRRPPPVANAPPLTNNDAADGAEAATGARGGAGARSSETTGSPAAPDSDAARLEKLQALLDDAASLGGDRPRCKLDPGLKAPPGF